MSLPELPLMIVDPDGLQSPDVSVDYVEACLIAYGKKIIGKKPLSRYRHDFIAVLVNEFREKVFSRVIFVLLRDQQLQPAHKNQKIKDMVYNILSSFMMAQLTPASQNQLLVMLHDLYNPLPTLAPEMYEALKDKYVNINTLNKILIYYMNAGLMVRTFYPSCMVFIVNHFKTRIFNPIMAVVYKIKSNTYSYFETGFDDRLREEMLNKHASSTEEFYQRVNQSRYYHHELIMMVHLLDVIFAKLLRLVEEGDRGLVVEMQTNSTFNDIKGWAHMSPTTLLLY